MTDPSSPVTPPKARSVDDEIRALGPWYLSRRSADIAKMRQMLGESRFDEIRVLAHQIKGSGGGYGFPELTRISSELERAAKAGDHSETAAQLALLDSCVAELRQSAPPEP